jgi:hypothetical protein
MPARPVVLFLFLIAAPVFGQQQPSIQTRISERIDAREQRTSAVVAAPGPDLKAARLQLLHRDAGELTTLSQTVQSDLRQLQKGMLVKDLNENLKKLEKLSKKVRREMQ